MRVNHPTTNYPCTASRSTKALWPPPQTVLKKSEMSGSKTVKGSCQCEKTSFSITHEVSWKPPIMICHCTHCQRLSGGFGTYNISFPIDSITWTGREPGKYEQQGDSGDSNTKVFCTNCGSTITTMAHKRKLTIMKIPSLREDIAEYNITPWWEQFVPSKFAIEQDRYSPAAVQFAGMKDRDVPAPY